MNTPKRIHMIAVCGVGMAPLAVLLKGAGHAVTGSDKAAYPPMSDVLEQAGVQVLQGFDASHLEPPPDLVVVGNAVTRSNPEAVEVERRGIERLSFPEAVARFFLHGHRSLVVAGTHGKTTTTGMLARALQEAGLEPGYLVGGLVRDLGDLARPARGDYFVIEGDEYDSAYFDKGPKFLHYQPAAAIVTSLEFDHADIYRDLDHVKSAFSKLAAIVPREAPLVCCADYPDLLDAVGQTGPARVIPYGSSASARWRPGRLDATADGSRFEVELDGHAVDALQISVPGRMNVLNGLAVYALCSELGVDAEAVKRALRSFRGAARRQEVVGEAGGVTVVDDFAHHPTAIAATIEAMRARYPRRFLRVVFEPRSNTSRRNVFQGRFTDALAAADAVVLSAVYAKENDPLRADEMLSTDRIVTDLMAAGRPAWVADGPDAILARLVTEVREGDVVVCMSNGGFGNLPRRLLAALGG